MRETVVVAGAWMGLLLDLYLGHLLGDFVFQPGWLVAAKRESVRGLLIHVGIIGACTAVILGTQLLDLWNIVALAMAAHLAIEVVTIRARSSNRLAGLSVFLIDQGLHLTSLVALVWTGSRIRDIENVATLGFDVGPAVLALACSLLGVMFMGAIVVHEVRNAFGSESMRRAILPYDWPRIYGMVERATALVLAVIINPALVFVPFLPRIAYLFALDRESRAHQMLAAAAGVVMCALGWMFVTLVTLATSPVL